MSDFDINTLKEKTEKSLNVLKEELGTVRAGRANAALVDKVTVDATESPLQYLGSRPADVDDFPIRPEEHSGDRTCDQCGEHRDQPGKRR